jgi:hypothetical protein
MQDTLNRSFGSRAEESIRSYVLDLTPEPGAVYCNAMYCTVTPSVL